MGRHRGSDISEEIGDAAEFIFSAPDATSALELAFRWQKEGRYQFFRGQENSEWKPYPSFLRVPKQSKELALERGRQFTGYTQRVARATGINYSLDDTVAIAQHYGIPTTFLDLTTDPVVAAMFACPPGSIQNNKQASILLYAQSTIDLWIEITRDTLRDTPIELLKIDVSNLWRLQAQHGLFLFNPVSNFCDRYMPDRVVFPIRCRGS